MDIFTNVKFIYKSQATFIYLLHWNIYKNLWLFERSIAHDFSKINWLVCLWLSSIPMQLYIGRRVEAFVDIVIKIKLLILHMFNNKNKL